MNDSIGRQSAIDAVSDMLKNVFIEHEEIARKTIGKLPSTSRWILCSERLPKDDQIVLITIRRMREYYNHKPFISHGINQFGGVRSIRPQEKTGKSGI